MRKKSLTKECGICEYCKMDDNSELLCHWGNGKPKLIKVHKTKPILSCNLINKQKDKK